MPKKKDGEYNKSKHRKVKGKKKAITSSAGSMTAKQTKNEKQKRTIPSLKRECRGIKHSEKQQVMKDMEDEITEDFELDEELSLSLPLNMNLVFGDDDDDDMF